LRNKNYFFIFALICALAAVPASAKTKGTTAKKGTKSKTAEKSSSKSSSGKRVASSAKGKSRKTSVAYRAPRQSEPTTERYMEIQQALVVKGHHPGPATGQWGPEWVTALKDFQQRQNLNPDGKLGALSLIALGLGPKREPLAQFTGKPERVE
jgi:peptidoglycan hydrolase-like protein with peptidoglycan-binding domain